LVIGGRYSTNLKVGDTEAGAALLFPNHPYNTSFRYFNRTFVGATQLVIIAEGKEKGAIKDYESLQVMEDFQRYMETEGGAGGTLTFTNMIKRIYRMFHEGHPKWEMIPESVEHLGQIGFLIASNTSPGEMDRWVDYSWTNGTITCFYKDYNNELIHDCIAKAKVFIDENPVEKIRFRLAGGLLGILAAVNEEVEWSYWASLIAVFVVVFLLCILTFRSFTADLLARISEEYETSGSYAVSNRKAVETTGKAIIFTATTLIAGVVFWAFIDLKFQAEMGLLLGLLMFLNMVNALIFIPSLVTIFRPKFVTARNV